MTVSRGNTLKILFIILIVIIRYNRAIRFTQLIVIGKFMNEALEI
ncbi:MAG: hypothetical protein QG565_1360, partial [Campylobacterota bacterium]|nr:hypothetical protein [Campylobacterota bacterium]